MTRRPFSKTHLSPVVLVDSSALAGARQTGKAVDNDEKTDKLRFTKGGTASFPKRSYGLNNLKEMANRNRCRQSRIYGCKIKLRGESFEVPGCVGISLLCATTTRTNAD